MDHVDSILAEWQAERPDLDAMPMGVMGRLKRLQVHLARNLETVFAHYGLNAASFDVLATLRRSGPPYALSPSALMDRTMVTSGTMTNRLDRLEAAGFIARRRNPEDGRGFSVALTDKGFSLIDEAVTAHVENQQKLIAALDPAERAALDTLLARWLAAFE
ncbi:MarR family winged helix-turn-helix transcriptional regulator [Martelella mediterranea]|uniref:Multiple antibiotic resistance protein MarR n=1 Tax=Martelella mediterranea DSM 17316 TaxID=1122214 RepID=A0A1U9YXB4_9HYPH|nr:MarR family transcriptional regulator [Martelella mediterranea]AQZ50074.1 Multiple antibiotic resistance protein MarR [Martelella mediterranea DSM 17316]